MSKKLRMYNVAFDDSFLLYEEKENLLVDLGSIDRSLNFDPIRDSIRSESVNKQLSLLLTHFHKDHWSGLRNQTPGHELPNLNKVYLPDIFQMRSSGKLDVIVRSLLSDFLDAVILGTTPRFSLADLLREVLPSLSTDQICFLSRGDVFDIDAKQYEVLWPQTNTGTIIPKQSKRFRAFLKHIEDRLERLGAESSLHTTLDRMATSLLVEFARFVDRTVPTTLRQDDLSYDQIYDQAQALAQRLIADPECARGELRNEIQYYADSLRGDWNRVSLVFHEKTGPKDEGVLMTGDIMTSTLKDIIHGKYGAPGLQKSYAVIKAPHHGTASHFCAILPQCQHLCISNGKGNQNYQHIAEEYEYVYGSLGKKASVWCTNTRCEFLTYGHCCPYLASHPAANFYDITW